MIHEWTEFNSGRRLAVQHWRGHLPGRATGEPAMTVYDTNLTISRRRFFFTAGASAIAIGAAGAAFAAPFQIAQSGLAASTNQVATAKNSAVTVLRGHTSVVASAAFSADGTRIVTASFDGTARIWDSATGKEMAVLRDRK